MDRKQLTETVSRKDADAEPPRMGSRRVLASCFRFMSFVNNGFSYLHWHRDMTCVSPPKTRRKTTYKDVGNVDIAGANIYRPWWLEPRI
jgi:hypothetical protein